MAQDTLWISAYAELWKMEEEEKKQEEGKKAQEEKARKDWEEEVADFFKEGAKMILEDKPKWRRSWCPG